MKNKKKLRKKVKSLENRVDNLEKLLIPPVPKPPKPRIIRED